MAVRAQQLRIQTNNEIMQNLLDIQRIVENIKCKQSILASITDGDTSFRSRVRWERASNGSVPRMAFLGGTDTSGEDLYIARALQDGDLTPGKLVPSAGMAYIPYCGSEIGHRNYEVLVSDINLQWVKCSGSDQLPLGAIQGGMTRTGEPLYIARTPHRGSVTPGKLQMSQKTCFISWGGKEHQYKEFKVLTSAP